MYKFFCLACNKEHPYTVKSDNPNHVWQFNGDMDKPSFEPSLRVFGNNSGTLHQTVCHCYVTDGKIRYCADSPHALAGQTVDMVEID